MNPDPEEEVNVLYNNISLLHSPGEDVEVGNRDLPATWANEPVAISESDLKHTVEPLSLVEVAYKNINGLNR
jgi:hypothetical protein